MFTRPRDQGWPVLKHANEKRLKTSKKRFKTFY